MLYCIDLASKAILVRVKITFVVSGYYCLKVKIFVLDNKINASIYILKFVISYCLFIYVDLDACICTAGNIRTVKSAETYGKFFLQNC